MKHSESTVLNCKEVRGLKSVRRALLSGASVIVLCASMPAPAQALDADALPSGGNVVGGSADFDYGTANELHIDQHSERVVIDWESFNIGSDALTEFHQNNSNSLAVNRVTGEGLDPTQILGQLKANGRVLVLDRNGVIFGEGAVVDVGSIVVSTGDVDTNAIMGGGNIEITDISGDGFILNEGSINVSEAGLAAFVAPTVVNNGIINAKLGRVQIGAGSRATIDLYGDGLMELELDQGTQQTLINNGIILAEGGSVQIEAAAAKDIVDNLIVNTGIIAADSVAESNGTITLYAEGGTTYNNGYITAAGYQGEETGGNIEVLGDTVILDNNTLIDASGDMGGGDIKIGGDYLGTGDTPTAKNTYVAGGALILNDAITNGDGGRTIVWSDDTTEFYGSIYGRGGQISGNGGFVETSGKINLLAQGYVDLTAANGDKGTYLLDPADITVYGNFDPTDIANLEAWFDAADASSVTLSYSTNGLGGATATGTIGTNTITTSINVSSSLEVGARIRLTAAGAVTTADTLGADTYTITNIAGTTITVEETLTATYAADALYRGLVDGWDNKNGAEIAAQTTASNKPLWVDNALNSNSVISFDGTNDYLTAGDVFDIRTNDRSAFSVFNFEDNTNGVVYAKSFYSGADGRYSLLRSGGNLTTLWDIGAANNNVAVAFASTAYTQSSTITERGAQNSFYLNGALQGNIAIAADFDDENPGNHFLIGVYNDTNGITPRPGFYLNGHVSEIIMYNDNLNADQHALVNQYQSAKWGVALDPLAGAGTEAAEAMDATNGFGAFTTRYLERLSDTADIVLQAGNSITLDLQGDTLNLANDRNISLMTTNGDITDVSAGTIQTNRTTTGGNISITAGGAGNINLDTTNLEALNGGTVSLSAGGSVSLSQTSDLYLGNVTGQSITIESAGDIGGNGLLSTSGGTLDITAGNDLDASNMALTSAGGNMTLDGRDVLLNTSVNAGAGTVTVNATRDIFLNQIDLTAGLAAYWNFDEGAGTSAADSSGNANNGTLVNGTAWSADTPSGEGYSLSFDGSNDHVVVADSNSLDLTDGFTLSMWMQSGGPQSNRYLLSKRNDAGTDNVYSVIYGYAANQAQFYASGNAFAYPSANSNLNVGDSNWHQVTYTYDGDTYSSYKDGVLVNSVELSADITASTSDLLLGTFNAAGFYFDGLMDDVRIYNDAISAGQVAQIQNPSWVSGTTNFNAGRDVVLNDSLSATDAGNSLTLSAERNFVNNAGANALDAGAGRWLVYSTDPAEDTPGGLTSNFTLYEKTHATFGPALVSNSGNGFVYSMNAPIVETSAPPPVPPSVDNVISNSSGQVNGSTPSEKSDLKEQKADAEDSEYTSASADCLISMRGRGCVVQ